MRMRSVRRIAVVIHQDNWCVARSPEVEVTSQGETVESALANLHEALEHYYETEP